MSTEDEEMKAKIRMEFDSLKLNVNYTIHSFTARSKGSDKFWH